MRSKIIFLLAMVALSSCTAPKYAYYFDHHNYNNVKRNVITPEEASPFTINPYELVASTSVEPATLTGPRVASNAVVTKTYLRMDRAERKAIRHHLRKEFKTFTTYKKSDGAHEAASTGWDEDLKLATIFGAVGITGLIIGGNVFNIIGAIALVIGVVFFVKWIIRQ